MKKWKMMPMSSRTQKSIEDRKRERPIKKVSMLRLRCTECGDTFLLATHSFVLHKGAPCTACGVIGRYETIGMIK